MEIRPIFSAMLRNKTAPLLVAIQIAISLAVLANALYVVQLRQAVAARPSGVADESTLVYAGVRPLKRLAHQETLAQQRRDAEALRALPGVVAVAWTNQMPMSRSGSSQSVTTDPRQARQTAGPSVYFSGDALLPTLGLKLVAGRDFRADDVTEIDDENDDGHTGYPKVAIVTQALAKALYPDAADVVGKTMYFGFGPEGRPAQIVGVVEALQTHTAKATPEAEYAAILPMRASMPFSRYAIRTQPGQRDRVLADAEITLRRVAPGPVETWGRAVETDRNSRYRKEKAMAWMLVGVSGLLLLVTASGIVGMTMLRVTQRRKQIGIRRALGGRRADIVRYFLTENVLITTLGVVGGAVLGLALNHVLVSRLELSRLPAAYLIGGAIALWVLGALAIYGPVLRAARISPATATRTA
jgi:putative ABC transport system permease protein